nr:uncharacterized protein LOC119179329 [Rhipicephalus microplus]
MHSYVRASEVDQVMRRGLRQVQQGPSDVAACANLDGLVDHLLRPLEDLGVLQYTPGKQLLNADALSRLPLRSTEADDVDSPPASDDWVVPMESNVYVRNYGVGEKWTPGRVQSTAGSRMVTVQTPHSVVRRHVDQVRPRQASQSPSPGSASLSESNMSMLPKRSPGPSTTSSTVLPPEALTTASPHDHPVPTMPQAGPTQAATPSAEPVLRRSTRQRKPVQRFHF